MHIMQVYNGDVAAYNPTISQYVYIELLSLSYRNHIRYLNLNSGFARKPFVGSLLAEVSISNPVQIGNDSEGSELSRHWH